MPATSTALDTGNKVFTGLAILVALVALYQWAQFLLVWGDSWAMAQALTWTFLTLVLFTPVLAIEYVQNRGD